MKVFRDLAICLAATALFAGCDGATSPPGPPARVDLIRGSGQSAVVATAVVEAPTVKVLSAKGKGVPKVAVSFQVGDGSGSVEVATQLTDGKGVASAGRWTLGSRSGTQTVTATVAGLPAVTFTASASAAEAAKLVLVIEPPHGANNNAPLTTQPVVQVTDQFGNAVALAGVPVTVHAHALRIKNGLATTNASGAATFTALTLSGISGVYRLRFSAPIVGSVDAASGIVLAAGPAAQLTLITGPPPSVDNGIPFGTHTVVEIRDGDGNRVASWAEPVTAFLEAGSGQLTGTTAVASTNGQAIFTDLRYNGFGSFRVRFSSAGLPAISTADITVNAVVSCTGERALTLDFAVGQMSRFLTSDAASPNCLRFELPRNLDQQYLVLFENMPITGSYNAGLFPGPNLNPTSIIVTVTTGPPSDVVTSVSVASAAALTSGPRQSWDFGAGPVYELEPILFPGGAPEPVLVRGAHRIGVNSMSADPVVGDTVIALLQGIPRLGLQSGNQRAVVRYVSPDLIIAEDVRLSFLPRQGGTYNTPMTQADLDSIGSAYSRHAKAQGDLLFGGRYNRAIDTQQRVLAVHTLMPSDNIWGYTYMNGSMFAFDYWVNSNGSVKGLNQHPLRNAHNLFMHEVAHMRHNGWLERANRTERGNQWLVEGFARFTERLPVAAYLMGQADPARTSNVVLPRYEEFGGSFFRDDVPTFLSVGSSMFGGYQASSFVFDYFADQVAATGGDWRAAVANFITNAGTQAALDAAIAAALPGLDFQQLFTRARIALYLDDLALAGLPAWTQYLQFQLRASRPAGMASGNDPQNAWPRVTPAVPFQHTSWLNNGGAFGYLLDGSSALTGMHVKLNYTAEHGVISITRIR